MVKKKYRLMFCFALILALSFFGISHAMNNHGLDNFNIVPLWTLISRANNYLYIDPNGQASMTVSVSAYNGVDRISITSHLQRYVNNTWVTIKHWTYENNGTEAYWSEEYNVSKGYNYRLVTYVFAYDGSSADSASLISKTQYY